MKLKLTFVCLTALALAACGNGGGNSGGDGDASGDGDGDTSGDGDGDTSGDGDGDTSGDGDGDGDTTPQGPSVEISVSPDIPGFDSVANLTTEEGATIIWTISSQPEGSTLTNDDLKGWSSAELSFVAQLAGEYELTAEVTLDGATTKKSVSFEVVGYDIPFAVMTAVPDSDETLTSHVAKVVSSGGGEPRDVGCTHEATDAIDDAEMPYRRHGGTVTRLPGTIEEPALILSQVISSNEEEHHKIEIAGSTTNCEENAPELRDVGTPVDPASDAFIPYRFSPNGNRFLGAADQDPDFAIFSDGGGSEMAHLLAVGQPDYTPHYAWMTDSVIAMTAGEGNAEDGYVFTMYKFSDEDGGVMGAELIMDCEAVTEGNVLLPSTQFMFRDNDLFLKAATGGVYLMKPSLGVYSCDMTSPQNTLLTGADVPGHFDVSSDGSLVVYQNTGAEIFAVVADGDSESFRISPDDDTSHYYPQFALGGRQIVWTSQYQYVAPEEGEEAPFDGNMTRVFRANADGENAFVVWTSEVPAEVTTQSTLGNQNGTNCSFGLPLGGGPAGFAGLALALGAALRRRKAHGESTQA